MLAVAEGEDKVKGSITLSREVLFDVAALRMRPVLELVTVGSDAKPLIVICYMLTTNITRFELSQ